MKKLLIAACLTLGLVACSDAPTAERVLRQNGYSDIKITGWSMFSCGKEDTFSTGFQATAPGGGTVDGAVCSSWLLKGATIRFN